MFRPERALSATDSPDTHNVYLVETDEILSGEEMINILCRTHTQHCY